MQYPIRKTLLVVCLAIAGVAFATTSISTKKDSQTGAQNARETVAPAPAPSPSNVAEEDMEHEAAELYTALELEAHGMKSEVFETAIRGFNKLTDEGVIAREDLITIADFSQPSTQKRFYVIDLVNKEILFQSLVSHGRGTGELWASSFSNKPSSYKSSPGYYVTQETYMGGHGYSLRLNGLEKGINDNARSRAIVMHGADYTSQSSINTLGFLGRSQGCPALPLSVYKPVINTIKDGTCLFIYGGQSYLERSELVG